MSKYLQFLSRKVTRTILVVQILTVSYIAMFSQDTEVIYSIENFFMDEGLPVIRIFDIAQDKNGLIWVCTEIGLHSFNGTDFEIHLDFGKINFYPNEMNFDNNGNIWLLSYVFPTNVLPKGALDNIKILNPNFEEIDPITYVNSDILDANKIIKDENGVLYFQTNDNIYSFDKSVNQVLLPLATSSYHYHDNQYTVVNDSTDIIILDSETTQEVVRIENNIAAYVQKYNDLLLIQYLTGELNIFNYKTKAFENKGETIDYTKGPYFYKSIDKNGIVWSIRLNSLRKFNIETKELEQLKEENYFKPGSYLTSIFADREDNIWIGSNQGLYKINSVQYEQFKFSANLKASTRAMLELDNDEVFVSSYDGDLLYNLKSREVTKLKSSGIKFSAVRKGDYYYTVTESNKLRKVKVSNHKVILEKKLATDKGFLNNPGVIIKTSDGKLFIKTAHSIYSFDEELNIKVLLTDNNVEFRNIQFINELIYLSTTGGLRVYNPKLKAIKTFLPNYTIKYVHQDKEFSNTLWLTTPSYLIKLETNTGDFQISDSESGFVSSIFTSIQEDDLGYLWLPSFAGLYRFNKKSKEIKVFFAEDGLANTEFNNYSSTISKNGDFVFGGISGLTVVDPKLAKDETIIVPEIQIYHCSKFNSINEIDLTTVVNRERKLEIEETDVLTNFTFAHYSYIKLKSKIYKYRILKSNGLDTIVPWVTLKSNELQIGKFPFGTYDLEFQAITRSGEKLSEINKVQLAYVTPFMKTNIFKAFAFLFLASFVYFLLHIRNQSFIQQKLALEKEVNLRTIQIQKQKEELEKINNTKDKLFSILAHDLKSPLLTLRNISGKINYLIKKNQPDRILEIGKTIEDKISNLSVFLDNLLNWSLQQRGHLSYNPEIINLNDLIQDILGIYEDQIEEKGLTVNLSIPKDSICYADKNSIHAVLRNLISNSIKYSPVEQTIDLKYDTGKFFNTISIIDNGKGIDQKIIDSLYNNENIQSEKGTKGELGTGLGLIISKELIELNKGHLKFLSIQKKGTRVEVHLPRAEK